MNTRDTLFRINPAWVVVGVVVFGAHASAQMRPRPGNLQVGHSEQGRVTGTHLADDNKTNGFRLEYDGDSDTDTPTFGGAADVDFRKQERSRIVEIDLRPTSEAAGGGVILIAADETAGRGDLLGPSTGTVPAPGTFLLVGAGACIATRRRR